MQEPPAVEPSLKIGTAASQIDPFAGSGTAGGLTSLAKIAAVTFTGLVMNWGFLVLFFWALHGHTGTESHTVALWVVGLILGLVFPATYLVAGQSLGAQIIMRSMYRRHRGAFHDFLIALLRKCVLDIPQLSATISREHVRHVLKQIDGMPWPVRLLVKFYVRDTGFQLLLLQMVTDEAFRSENARALKEKYSPELDAFIMEGVLDVNTGGLWILVIVNVACAALLFMWAFLR